MAEAHLDRSQRSRIAVLSERVQNQIAAGEVIERPASVVKELVENALDAGARRIQIDLEEGGAQLVRVTDDGWGMPREDLELAFLPHATSKLFEIDDLDHIASLGFRGEALASIGAVSRTVLYSRESALPLGWRIENHGGKISAPAEAGGPAGTAIEVRELFFNVPARRRFLKRASTELARALDLIQRLALAHAGVGFVAMHDGRRLFDVEPTMDLRARIRRAFGADVIDGLVSVDAHDGDVALTGFLGAPRLARADTQRQMWFLNGRVLRDKVLLRALQEGYRGLVFDRRHPVAFLNLAMDPARVDVNVHPTKAEVRFRDERRLFGFVVSSVRAALTQADLATPGTELARIAARNTLRDAARPELFADAVRDAPVWDAPRTAVPGPRGAPGPHGADGARVYEPGRAADAGASHRSEAPISSLGDDPRGPFLQIARTYLVRALTDGFEIIDQHALHERITFEGLLSDMRTQQVTTQRYLVPELVEVSRDEAELISGHFDALQRIGLELAVFGPTTIAVHGLPARLERPDPPAIVREVLAVLDASRAPRAEDLLEEVLHRAACRSSVMAGDELTAEEIRSLIERGRRLESDQTCVHGRPTRVHFSLADLEKVFHRR